jgi:hypothetical protein
VTQELVKAVKKMTALRTEGTKVDVYLNQGQLFSDDMTPEDLAMLKVVNQYSRSAKKLKQLFNNMVDIIYGAGHPEQEVLFGDMKKEPPTKIEVIQRAAKMIEVEEQSILGDVKDTEAQSLGEIDTPFRLEEVSKNDVLVGAESASVGMYARPITSPEEVKPIEMPELVEIAKEINKGIYPEIRKAIRSGHGTALGTFIRNTESGKIVLRADIFLGQEIATLKGKPKSDQERQIAIDKIIDKVVKTHGGTPDDYVVKWEKNKANGQTIFHVYEVDPELAPKVLAHEIGHLIDWLPDKDMSRGNILGHIATLKKFMSTTIGAIPKKPDDYLKPQERAKFARMAEKEAGEDEELRKTLYDNLVAEEIKKRGLVTRDQIMEELKALSQAWKPFDESSATPQYLKYRYSPKELYADFVSVLFNDSTVASRYAPSVSQMFIDYLERKPEVKTALESVQDRYLDRNELKQQRLIDLYAMMERGDELRQLARENNVTTYEPIKDTIATALIDANWPLLKRIAQREKDPIELIREAATQARYAIESLPYVDSRIEAMWRGYADLIQDATDNGVSANDIGVYGFLRRVAYERTQLANPRGHTPKSAKELIEFMEGKLDEDKVAFLQKFGDEFHRTRKQMILPALEEGGIITDQLLEYAKSNAVYMKFDVAKYFEETFGEAGAKLYRQIGTLDEIANPWIATMLQDAALLRAATINKAKLTIMKDLIIGDDAVPADMVYSKDRGGLVPKEPKDKEKALFVVMEKGKPRYYYVDREIAKTFEYEPHKATLIAQLWNLVSTIVKDAIAGKNPIWQARNIPRDFFESYKKLDVVGVLDAPKLAAMYGKAFIESVRYVFGGNASEDIQKGLWEMALPSGRIYDARDKHWEDEIDRISYEWLGKLLPTETSEKLKANHLVTLADKFNSTLPMRLLERAGRVSDLTGKLAAYKYIEKYAPEMSVEQRAHDVRTKAATPNFKARGTKHRLMNNLFAWSNVRIQGMRASVESYRKNPSRFIWKTILANILPKVALWGISMWGTGTVAKKVIDKASEYNKRNYLFIPLGLTEDGKDAVYLRLPQDDFGTAISAGVWDALWTISSVIKKDGEWDERALKALRETAVAANPYSLHPLIDVGIKAGLLYGLGINPQDTWRGYSVISPLAFQAGGWDMHKEFLAYTWNALGGSAFYTMPTSVEIDKDESQLKKTLRKPLANIVGTFLRIDHAGETEQVYKILEDTASEEAKPKLAKNKAIIEAVNAGKSAIIAYNELAKAGLVDKKKESLTQFTNTYEKYQAKKEGDPWVMGIYAASTAKQKAALFKKMPADIRKRFEKEYDLETGYKK